MQDPFKKNCLAHTVYEKFSNYVYSEMDSHYRGHPILCFDIQTMRIYMENTRSARIYGLYEINNGTNYREITHKYKYAQPV